MNFKFSDVVEELYIKPVIWLLPFLYIFPKDKLKPADFGITFRNFFPSVYLSVALGVGFAFLGLISNIVKYHEINFEANIGPMLLGTSLLVSFATSVTEELVFRGYLLSVFLREFDRKLIPIFFSTILWTAMHGPISYFVWGMNGVQILIYLTLTFFYGLGASVIFVRTKNIASSVFLHVLWEWPIVLFR